MHKSAGRSVFYLHMYLFTTYDEPHDVTRFDPASVLIATASFTSFKSRPCSLAFLFFTDASIYVPTTRTDNKLLVIGTEVPTYYVEEVF